MLLENELFLSRLTLMFDKSRSKGHVDLNMKRYDGRTKPIPKPRKNVKQKGKKTFVSIHMYILEGVRMRTVTQKLPMFPQSFKQTQITFSPSREHF